MRFKLLIGALLAAAVVAGPSAAKTLRWASQGDILTFDPMSQNESLNNTFSDYIYEGLVRYNKQFVPEPALATSWTRVSPTVWRFSLRRNVKFHDGSSMNADDVVFSFQRVLAPSSNMKVYAQGIKETRKVDDYTVEIVTDGPNPVLLRGLVDVKVMSKAWATKHNVLNPQDYVKKEETHAARNANGTGQFMLKSFEADVRTVLVANPNWWDKAEGNVTEIVYRPIKQDSTRAAALLSNEIDLVLDPPTQDIPRLRQNSAIKIADGTETRIIFLGFDQWRDESPYTDVKGKNPFKDKRVRQALYQAIDIEAIRRATMRGLAVPTGSMIAPQVNGYFEEFAKRLPHDEAAAKRLLSEAGYPNGFSFTLDCPNNRYINDEEICIAITAMWAKVGLKAKLNAMPRATYFQKIQKFDTSVYLLGWATATFDGLYTLQSLIRSPAADGKGADGNFNLGKYSNAKADALIDQVKTEIDDAKRNQAMRDAQRIHAEDIGHIPLHQQVIPWAMRSNVSVFHRADNRLDGRWVRVD
ncbi:MAG: ABC transporter substrate-binding protein [Burkholderiales bacterium]|nr:ABC transporter substrate-binding protein [Burkholderiales bacterium]GIK87152.1 MAG: binding-protein-dependent transporter [Betaproteobacteria bacterium]